MVEWLEHRRRRRRLETRLGPRFIFLLPQAAVLPVLDAGSDGVEPTSNFFHSKPSDFVLRVVPNVWDILLGRGLRFVQRRRARNSVKERNIICAWTNEIA